MRVRHVPMSRPTDWRNQSRLEQVRPQMTKVCWLIVRRRTCERSARKHVWQSIDLVLPALTWLDIVVTDTTGVQVVNSRQETFEVWSSFVLSDMSCTREAKVHLLVTRQRIMLLSSALTGHKLVVNLYDVGEAVQNPTNSKRGV